MFPRCRLATLYNVPRGGDLGYPSGYVTPVDFARIAPPTSVRCRPVIAALTCGLVLPLAACGSGANQGTNGPDGRVNAGVLVVPAVGTVSNAAGTCISTINPAIQSAPNLLCLAHRIATRGECVEIEVATPAVSDAKPLLFPGKLVAELPQTKCSSLRPVT